MSAIDIGLSVGAGPSPIGADEGAKSVIGSGVGSTATGTSEGVSAIDIGLSVGAGPSPIGVVVGTKNFGASDGS